MKESVWYNAIDNEIIVRQKNGRIERGCQAIISCPSFHLNVPDYLNLFTFKVKKGGWKRGLKEKWLTKLGDL